MDESQDHEQTLIERGMGVHLNHLITAQRGIRNSRPARWELWKPHPPSRGGTARECIDKTESTPRSPQLGPGSGAQRMVTPPGNVPNADVCRIRAHGTAEAGWNIADAG
jgi:hypothetical protein